MNQTSLVGPKGKGKFLRRKQRQRKRAKAPLYPTIPKVMRVCLHGRTYETGSSTASPVFLRYGLVEFLHRGGNFTDSLFGLYNNAIVHSSQIHLRLVNMSSEPIILAVCPLPFNWTTGSPTLGELLDDPGMVRTTVGSNSGMDRVALTSFTTTRAVTGKAYNAAKYQMDSTQAASATPLFTDEPCWVVVVSAFNASTAISYRLEIELAYNSEFFNLTSV